MKKIFRTPKRAIIFITCMVIAIAAISVMAVKSTLITKAEAAAVALRDVGCNESEASALRTRLTFDDGRFQYEVDFYNNGIAYEYSIQAKDGDIIARDMEGSPNGSHDPKTPPQNAENRPVPDENNSVPPREDDKNRPVPDGNVAAQPQEISPEEAKAAALKDAGLSESDVRFTKTELEYDDGRAEYEVEFYYAKTEYDYTIDAFSGNIIEYDVDYD